MSTNLPAVLLLERPCQPCQDGWHLACARWPSSLYVVCCCYDDLDRDPDPPRRHP